jgi:catechol 2,3-dioxygenase-like lactoylglutathione lyase family enzyme
MGNEVRSPLAIEEARTSQYKERDMVTGFDQLLTRYESGQISRRELLGGLAALAVVAPANAAAPSIASVAQMNHVTLFVKDVKKSVEFYQRLFGLPVLTLQDPGVNLRVGASFLGIYPAGDRPASINHVCFGLDKFDADETLEKLTDAGVKGRIRQRGDTKELYFTDPDNLSMQLQDTRYIGGKGALGDQKPK